MLQEKYKESASPAIPAFQRSLGWLVSSEVHMATGILM